MGIKTLLRDPLCYVPVRRAYFNNNLWLFYGCKGKPSEGDEVNRNTLAGL